MQRVVHIAQSSHKEDCHETHEGEKTINTHSATYFRQENNK